MSINNYKNLEINKILLERKNKIIINDKSSTDIDNTQILLTISKNIEDLGFLFTKELFNTLCHQKKKNLEILYAQMVPVLKKMVGAHVAHKPFYKNFPQEMISLSDLDIYLNAIIHYWTNGRWAPEYAPQLRFPLENNLYLIKQINIGSFSDFHQIFIEMLKSKGSLSSSDQALLGWYIEKSNPSDLIEQLPESIPSKETLSLVLSKIWEFHPQVYVLVSKFIKTATDILRLVTSLSEGDISLASNTVFRNFSRLERRSILSLLNECKNIEEDMWRYPGKWIRIGEKLHPGDYSEKFPIAFQAFQKIRNGIKVSTFNSRIENRLKDKDIINVLILLEKRPGELARRLDHLLRLFPDSSDEIVHSFSLGVSQISSPVLLQLSAHFLHRDREKSTRSFFPKGNIAKIQVVEKAILPLSKKICQDVVSICDNELIRRFHEKPDLGRVYIAPELKEIIVPLAQRSSSQSLKTYARGSQFTVDGKTNTIRAFIHWKNILGTSTDVDLSLGLYNPDWDFVEHISYTNIRSEKFEGVYHSGDIVTAPDGASEFIDMNLIVLREKNIRYAVFNIYVYSGQGFNEIPECFFGWMEREKPESGEIFEPKAVANKIDLASPTTICLPVLIDLFKMKVYWLDISLKSNPNWVNNIEANRNNVVLISKAMIELVKPNLFDLFSLHGKARGTLVDSPEEAQVRFGINESDDVNPFQVETILSEYL